MSSAITSVSQIDSSEYKIGWVQDYEKTLRLRFDSTSEDNFLRINASNQFIDTKIDTTKPDFKILTQNRAFMFKHYKDYGNNKWEGFECKGYNPKLKLYAIEKIWTSDEMGFSQLTLIDSITSLRYDIMSIGDGAVSIPSVSPNEKFMAYYSNTEYEQKGCTIGILKINSKKSFGKYIEEYRFYETEEFAIEEIRWINDTSFIVKGYEEVYENETWVKKYSYYKTSL